MEGKSPTHKIFSGNPVHQHSLIHRRVRVTTSDLKEHTGWVYTIDPVSESVILVTFDGDEKTVTIVMGYNIKSLTPLDDTPPPGLAEAVDSIFRKEQVHYSSQEVTARREAMCVWLADNRVPYTVNEDMVIQCGSEDGLTGQGKALEAEAGGNDAAINGPFKHTPN
ncbi:Gem-associated protein 6 [Portunus trituberculatus]|uniref:Gem-associated protein 6 n=1 Tax=Portunus trituberculatus TaxID=210409 RepID=A0A5B7CSX1_PORTR|nr:Gem-associated protein 6 [Portunus trituberculatus]